MINIIFITFPIILLLYIIYFFLSNRFIYSRRAWKQILVENKGWIIKYFLYAIVMGILGQLIQTFITEYLPYHDKNKDFLQILYEFKNFVLDDWQIKIPYFWQIVIWVVISTTIILPYAFHKRRGVSLCSFPMGQPEAFNLINEIDETSDKNKSNKKMIPELHKKDHLVTSPIEYAVKTIKDNVVAPEFDADADYINLLYDKKNTSIIAITGWTPSMWIDPALSFYLENTLVVSLVNELNNKKTRTSGNLDIFHKGDKKYTNHKNLKLKLLKDELTKFDGKLKKFNVIRFFILKEKWISAFKDQYLSALYAIHDLFHVKAYFINENRLLASNNGHSKSKYSDYIEYFWGKFELVNNQKIDNSDRKSPEFLFIYRNDEKLKIRACSYYKGKGLYYPNNSTVDSNYFDTSIDFIKLLSTLIKDDMLFTPTTNRLENRQNSIIDWT